MQGDHDAGETVFEQDPGGEIPLQSTDVEMRPLVPVGHLIATAGEPVVQHSFGLVLPVH